LQFKEVKKMKWSRFLTIGIALIMIFSLAACGQSKEASSEGSVSISTADQQEVADQLAEEAAAVPEPDTQAVPEASAASDSSLASNEDKLVGEWVDINDATRTVKIASNGSEYQYTDADGTYSGTVKDGVLTIKISDAEGDTAMVFIDAKTGNMVTNYQGDIYEFTKNVQQQ
jgi:uncharacterized iron-regulated membrane protein